MKIVQGSLPLQEEEMRHAVTRLYKEIFPFYLSDTDIEVFKKNSVLALPDANSHAGTLKGAFEIMACLQTIMIILEEHQTTDKAVELFDWNSRLLNDLGLFFPFNHEQFFGDERKIDMPHHPTHAANTYLI